VKKQKINNFCIKLAIILSLTLLILPITQNTIAISNSEDNFSIIWITDTQYLSEQYPEYYENLCEWIVENKGVYNVKMVVHTGDIVNDEGNYTQWLNANHSMGILLDNNIPYCWNAGNHDYNVTYWIGNQFTSFNPEVMREKQYWLDDKNDGMNTAVKFSIDEWNCLIVNIAFNADDSVLSWTGNLLDEYAQSHAIVGMHSYLNKDGKYNNWATNVKDTVLDKHSNVFLTLSAHYYPTSGVWVNVGERDELLFNQQDAFDMVGGASVRILTFDVNEGTISIKTFLVHSKQYLEDENNNFLLHTSFWNSSAGKNDNSLLLTMLLIIAITISVIAGFFVKRKRQLKHTKPIK